MTRKYILIVPAAPTQEKYRYKKEGVIRESGSVCSHLVMM
jgi:hypothetical protein